MTSERGSTSPLSGFPVQPEIRTLTPNTLLDFKSNLEILAAQRAALLQLNVLSQTGFMSNLVAQSQAQMQAQLQKKEQSASPPVTPPNSTPSQSMPTTPAAPMTTQSTVARFQTQSETSTNVSNISPLSSASYLPGQPGPFPPGIQNIKDLLLLQQQQQLQQAQHLQQLQHLQQVCSRLCVQYLNTYSEPKFDSTNPIAAATSTTASTRHEHGHVDAGRVAIARSGRHEPVAHAQSISITR